MLHLIEIHSVTTCAVLASILRFMHLTIRYEIVSILTGCDVTSMGIQFPAFRDYIIVSFSRFEMLKKKDV